MINLFFFDVDGTLLDNKSHTISESTIKALRMLKEAGKKIVICSGRGYNGIREVEALRAIEWDGYVLLNGAIFTDGNGNEHFRHVMSKTLIRKLMKASKEHNLVLSLLGEKEWLNQEPDEYTVKAYHFFHRNPYEFEVEALDETKSVSMALAFGPEEWDYAPYKAIKELLVLPTKFNYADLNDASINKSVGIKEACRYFDIDLKQTMAFGDGINDLEMIEAAGIGVAMGQGNEVVKQAADYITDAVDQDGIWNALIHFGVLHEDQSA